jgi:hypothetical protein
MHFWGFCLHITLQKVQRSLIIVLQVVHFSQYVHYNACMYSENRIWWAFKRSIPDAFSQARKTMFDGDEIWLRLHFLLLCQEKVFDSLNLSEEERDDIISLKAQAIHEMRDQAFDLNACRELPLNVEDLYAILCRKANCTRVDGKKYKALRTYQRELSDDLMKERRSLLDLLPLPTDTD